MSVFDNDLVTQEFDNKTIIKSVIASIVDKSWESIKNKIIGVIGNFWKSDMIENTIIGNFIPLDNYGNCTGKYIPELTELGLGSTCTNVELFEFEENESYFEIRVEFRMDDETWDDADRSNNVYECKKYIAK